MSSQKQSGPANKREKEIWVIYNAWLRGGRAKSETGSDDRISEAAVEDELRPVAEGLEELGFSPEVYALSSILDLVMRISGTGKPKLIFNLAEGFRGAAAKEMNVAALFELLDIPYTGNPARTLAAAQDKILTKRLLVSAGIPTPRWKVFQGGEFPCLGDLSYPLIAKPAREDSSLGIRAGGVFSDLPGIRQAAQGIFGTYRQPVLIEEFIDGREIGAAILETEGRQAVLPLSEILFDGLPPGAPRITSYEAKWLADSVFYTGTPAVCPAAVEAGLKARIEKTAVEVFALLGGKDYGRVDFRVDPAGNPFVLEYNPNPDISPAGGFARSLAAAGIGFRDFLDILVRNNRHG
ncbi:MAG: D-alanine--D-alanine ligase [Spirochaetia bacterium]|jgi:D-alanine-D-alanine ligase|nr:D-alanine--D-alanine ligase [Spirochaetia bacterium]